MGLKLNFSENEANSAPREIAATGEYHCKVTEIQHKEVNPGSKNAGKPYWNIKFVIQDNPKDYSPLYSNIMLFEGEDGTLGSLAQFLKAVGFEITAGTVELPDPDMLEGRDLVIRGVKKPAGYDARAKRELNERFQVTGYKKYTGAVKTGNTSLLP